jgi:hypothetical protein
LAKNLSHNCPDDHAAALAPAISGDAVIKAIFKGLLGAPTVPSALLTYGSSTPELFRSSAGYVDKKLKGARPTDLPMQQPTTFELSINFHAAQRLGIAIPPTVDARADKTF